MGWCGRDGADIQYIIRGMPLRMRVGILVVLGAITFAGCSGRLFGKQYEYEEDLTLALDGSATLIVNSSLAALVALRGIEIDPSPRARLDRDKIRDAYRSPVA